MVAVAAGAPAGPAMSSPVNVGDVVQAQCGACHDATPHEILAVDARGRPGRCRCLTPDCGATHLFRKPTGPDGTPPRRDRRAEQLERRRAQQRAEHARLLEAAAAQDVTSYRLSGVFAVGQRLLHDTFGEGVVTSVVAPNVIEVVFEGGPRRLAQGR
jgi:hypothetical protein